MLSLKLALVETDSLALTDSRQLGRLNSGLDSLVGSPLLQLNELDCCDALVLKLFETLLLSDVDVLTLLLKLTEVLLELLLTDSDALIDADTLVLMIVLADAEALIEADTLVLMLVLAD